MIPYKPLSGIRGFFLELDQNGEPKFLVYQKGLKHKIRFIIKPSGYLPKSGIYLCDKIKRSVKGKNVLDLCTGEAALLTLYAAEYGAKSVVGSDIDGVTVEWAKKNVKLNGVDNVKIIRSDLFNKVEGRFDLIVSNAPQMPMVGGGLHDSGGPDGRKIIEQIIAQARNHLNPKGEVVLLVFDFLGVNKSFDDEKSIIDFFREFGFSPSVIGKRKLYIRKGGQTEKSIEYINKVFPKYIFGEDKDGRKFHYLLVVKGEMR